MANFGDFPPNMTPQDALVVRSQAEPEHAVTKYSAEDLSKPVFGPSNPFRAPTATEVGQKRKNVLTGVASETYLSEHTFRSKHRAVERRGGPAREALTGQQIKEQNAKIRAGRQSKGSATIVDGDGEYIGPWAKHKRREVYADMAGDGYGYDEDDEGYEIVEEYEDDGEDDAPVESGTVLSAPAQALKRRQEVAEVGDESSRFLGSEQYDYQGRTYMHVPQDLDIDLRKEAGSITNYIPKKVVHTWKSPTGTAVTALQLFPASGHLLLSGSADNKLRIWDVYHRRELLREFVGHTRALTDVSFNRDGTRFISGGHDRWMKLWDTETGQCINRFRTGKTPHCLVFNPSAEGEHEFLSGMSDNKILQWDIRAGGTGDDKPEPVQTYDHHLAAINTIVFVDENRRFMTTSDDKSVRVWDYNIPVPITTTAEPWMFPLTRAALHPSGKYVAYQSSDNQVLVYAARDKYRQNRKKAFKGHNNAGTAVGLDISPDGQFLASGDTQGSVYVFDWKTCKQYSQLKADSAGGSVNHVLWHPQETSKMVTAGQQGDIKLWD